jgi:hypothetical protein
MHRIELRLLEQELEPLHVPGDVSGIGFDLKIWHRRDEPAPLFLEVAVVCEGEFTPRSLEDLNSVLRRRLAFGVKVTNRGTLLCQHRAALEHRFPACHDSSSDNGKSSREPASRDHPMPPRKGLAFDRHGRNQNILPSAAETLRSSPTSAFDLNQ